MSDIKFPDVRVRLVGEDGNAFSIMGRVTGAMKRQLRGLYTREEIDSFCSEYMKEATSSDYDSLLVTTMNWVNCDDED